MKKILKATIILVVIAGLLIGYVRNSRIEMSKNIHKATLTTWQVLQTHHRSYDTDYIGERIPVGFVEVEGKLVKIWLRSTSNEKKTVIITIYQDSPQLERYLKVKPGDTLQFEHAPTKPDDIRGPHEFRPLRLAR